MTLWQSVQLDTLTSLADTAKTRKKALRCARIGFICMDSNSVDIALTSKSTTDPAENFSTDRPASEFAEMYKRDGLVGGHVIMLGSGNEEAVS